MNKGFRAGELVEVRSADEVLKTLDGNGALGGLPFMPEMIEFCGKRFRVSYRIVQAVIDGAAEPNFPESYVREFIDNDVVLLEKLRCSGIEHDGCQRGCMIFWKEAWLRKVENPGSISVPNLKGKSMLQSRLKTKTAPGVYYCQSSEFYKATKNLKSFQRIKKCFDAVRAGNCGALEMVKILAVWSYWQTRKKVLGPYPRGNRKPTPVESLNLQPGDLVEVKPLSEIVETLDKNGKNRGLHFSADMPPFCGRRFRVRSRADKLITEITGRMAGFPNTVILEGLTCDTSIYAFGGCHRMDFLYWREIWLKKVV